ncbi:MAG: acetamidase/formamidase family protein [Bacteroidota bacterium]
MRLPLLCLAIALAACQPAPPAEPAATTDVRLVPEPQYQLTREQTHNKFSSAIPPVLTVASGAVIEAYTEEASDGQFSLNSTVEDVLSLDFEPIHPLTGPVYVEGAEPGDVVAVTLHEIEIGAFGWTAVVPGFGFLADDFPDAALKTFTFETDADGHPIARFSDDIVLPLNPFPGVMGVAPATDEMLSTIPPRANGGNMDDPNMTEGTTVYFPVFVEGALFSIGDAHAAQGAGEVCGTAIEAPMRIVYEIELIKGRSIPEPQYENATHYAVTAFAPDLDEAARKANRYMIDYIEAEHGLSRTDAYMLTSLAADLKIAEVVDVPHMLVTMHLPKGIFE